MNSLDILKAKVNMNTTILKFKKSIEDLEKNNPHRNDLINSMTESLKDVEDFNNIFLQLEQEYKMECKINFRHQTNISDLKFKIKELQLQLKINKEDL
jgi:hypothetical protein